MSLKRSLFALLFLIPVYGLDVHQNWPFANQFWTVNQGSKVMPWDWFMHLENAAGTGLLKDDLASFGFIPGALKETGLPVGFAKHVDAKGQMGRPHLRRLPYRNVESGQRDGANLNHTAAYAQLTQRRKKNGSITGSLALK